MQPIPNNVICFRHPGYDGTTAPVIACKTCCGTFVAEIKARNAAGPEETIRQRAGAGGSR